MKLRLLVFVGLLTSLFVHRHRQVQMMLPSSMSKVELFLTALLLS